MKPFDDTDVQLLAFELWEQAGRPDGKMDEFWYEAERRLKERQIQAELKTPDTL